jgi:hypothetical protein
MIATIGRGFAAVWLAVLLAVLHVSVAGATTVRIDELVLDVPMPGGHCMMNRNKAEDNGMIQSFEQANEGINDVLMVFAKCDQLDDWRTTTRPYLDDLGQVITPSSLRGMTITHPRDVYIKAVADNLKANDPAVQYADDIERRIDKAFEGTRLDQMTSLGLIEYDKNGAYGGIIERIIADDGVTERTVATVYGITLVRGKVLGLHLVSIYDGPETVTDLVAQVKRSVQAMIDANERDS